MAAIDSRIQAVTDYARQYITARHKAGATWVEIAKELDITPSWAQQLWNPKQYGKKTAGIDLILALADKAHGRSVDALFDAATQRLAPPEKLPGSERPVGEDRVVKSRKRQPKRPAKRGRKEEPGST